MRDLALRAHDALAHGRLRDQEGARDLAGAQAAERAQCERHARRQVQRRVTAGEDQPQPIVDDHALVVHGRLLGLGEQARQLGQPFGAVGHRPGPPQAVDRPPARGGGEPRPRVGRDPVAPPDRDRGLERVLHGVLGQLEVTDLPDQRGQHARALLTERALDGGRDRIGLHASLPTSSSDTSTPASRARSSHSADDTTGRTSIVLQRAIGSRAACLSASSRSAHSST